MNQLRRILPVRVYMLPDNMILDLNMLAALVVHWVLG
jgi:hypothetical protein